MNVTITTCESCSNITNRCQWCGKWLIGYRIAEEELKGNDRADYGIEIIKKLSKELTKEYGKGFDPKNNI